MLIPNFIPIFYESQYFPLSVHSKLARIQKSAKIRINLHCTVDGVKLCNGHCQWRAVVQKSVGGVELISNRRRREAFSLRPRSGRKIQLGGAVSPPRWVRGAAPEIF